MTTTDAQTLAYNCQQLLRLCATIERSLAYAATYLDYAASSKADPKTRKTLDAAETTKLSGALDSLAARIQQSAFTSCAISTTAQKLLSDRDAGRVEAKLYK